MKKLTAVTILAIAIGCAKTLPPVAHPAPETKKPDAEKREKILAAEIEAKKKLLALADKIEATNKACFLMLQSDTTKTYPALVPKILAECANRFRELGAEAESLRPASKNTEYQLAAKATAKRAKILHLQFIGVLKCLAVSKDEPTLRECFTELDETLKAEQ